MPNRHFNTWFQSNSKGLPEQFSDKNRGVPANSKGLKFRYRLNRKG